MHGVTGSNPVSSTRGPPEIRRASLIPAASSPNSRYTKVVYMHEGQLTVTEGLVRELVGDQVPVRAGLPTPPLPSARTGNAIFRIGYRLAGGFPLVALRDADATRQWLVSEAEAARELAAHTAFPVPEPVAIGDPGFGYPLPWSVQTWLPGSTANESDPSRSDAFAHDLARFIWELRAIDIRG